MPSPELFEREVIPARKNLPPSGGEKNILARITGTAGVAAIGLSSLLASRETMAQEPKAPTANTHAENKKPTHFATVEEWLRARFPGTREQEDKYLRELDDADFYKRMAAQKALETLLMRRQQFLNPTRPLLGKYASGISPEQRRLLTQTDDVLAEDSESRASTLPPLKGTAKDILQEFARYTDNRVMADGNDPDVEKILESTAFEMDPQERDFFRVLGSICAKTGLRWRPEHGRIMLARTGPEHSILATQGPFALVLRKERTVKGEKEQAILGIVAEPRDGDILGLHHPGTGGAWPSHLALEAWPPPPLAAPNIAHGRRLTSPSPPEGHEEESDRIIFTINVMRGRGHSSQNMQFDGEGAQQALFLGQNYTITSTLTKHLGNETWILEEKHAPQESTPWPPTPVNFDALLRTLSLFSRRTAEGSDGKPLPSITTFQRAHERSVYFSTSIPSRPRSVTITAPNTMHMTSVTLDVARDAFPKKD